MLARFRPRLTYANVVSTLCLFIVLGGGAYAAVTLPPNSVGTKQLKAKAVKRAKIAPKAVTTPKLAPNAATGAKVKESSLAPVPEAQHADRATDSDLLSDHTFGYFEAAQRHEFGSGNHASVNKEDLLEWTNAYVKVTTDGQSADTASVLVRNTAPTGGGPLDLITEAGGHQPVAQGAEFEVVSPDADLHFEIARPDGRTIWVRCAFPAFAGAPARCLGERSGPN
jgi:hypothetical protein